MKDHIASYHNAETITSISTATNFFNLRNLDLLCKTLPSIYFKVCDSPFPSSVNTLNLYDFWLRQRRYEAMTKLSPFADITFLKNLGNNKTVTREFSVSWTMWG
jgi:hypothetical protein